MAEEPLEESSDRRSGVSRRTVVLGVGGAATAAFVALAIGTQLDDDTDETDTGNEASTAPNSDDAIKQVGVAYRAAYPDQDDLAVLEAALPSFEGLTGEQVEAQLDTLNQQVRDDFTTGNVVTVDGWILAATEAQAAALVSMLS